MHRTGDQGNSTLRGWGLRAGEGCKEYKNEKPIIQGSSTYIIDTFLHFTKKQARFSRLARKLKRRRGLFSFSEPLPFEQFRFSAGSKARRPGSAALAAASSVTFSPHDSPRKVTPRTPSVLYYQLGFQCQEWGPWLPLSAPDTGRHSVHADR